MLVILTSHPIQYQAPLWRALACAGVKFQVWFLTSHAVQSTYDAEFGQSFAWDVDLLGGYPHRFVEIEPGWRLDRFDGVRPLQPWKTAFEQHGVTHVWLEGWRFKCLWTAAFAAHAAGLKVWLRGENHALAPAPWHHRLWKRPLLRRLFAKVDVVLCIGRANRDFYRLLDVNASRLHAAPYAVDNTAFANAARELRPLRAKLREDWQVSPGAFTILFCGKLITKKRPHDLVAASRLAAHTSKRPLHLLFVGDGELMPALKTALAEPGVPAATLIGFLNQSRIPEAFAAADCLVLPSDYGETWGLVVNEALASGLPAIVSDHCGCAADLGLAQGTGHVFPFGDIPALATAINRVEAHTPSPASLMLLIERHSIDRTVETVTHLLSEA
jgi:glycosyltransferase involved in cell wall biosynthesis